MPDPKPTPVRPTPLWLKAIKTYLWYGVFVFSLLIILGREVHPIHLFLWAVLSAYMTWRDRPVTRPVRYDSRKAFAAKLQLMMPDRYELVDHSNKHLHFRPQGALWAFFIDPLLIEMQEDGATLTGSSNHVDRLRRLLAVDGVIKIRTREQMRAGKDKGA